MTPFIQAIRNITRYPEKLITQTIDMVEKHNIEPLQAHGSMQWDVWLIYRVLREYERLTTTVNTD